MGYVKEKTALRDVSDGGEKVAAAKMASSADLGEVAPSHGTWASVVRGAARRGGKWANIVDSDNTMPNKEMAKEEWRFERTNDWAAATRSW